MSILKVHYNQYLIYERIAYVVQLGLLQHTDLSSEQVLRIVQKASKVPVLQWITVPKIEILQGGQKTPTIPILLLTLAMASLGVTSTQASNNLGYEDCAQIVKEYTSEDISALSQNQNEFLDSKRKQISTETDPQQIQILNNQIIIEEGRWNFFLNKVNAGANKQSSYECFPANCDQQVANNPALSKTHWQFIIDENELDFQKTVIYKCPTRTELPLESPTLQAHVDVIHSFNTTKAISDVANVSRVLTEYNSGSQGPQTPLPKDQIMAWITWLQTNGIKPDDITRTVYFWLYQQDNLLAKQWQDLVQRPNPEFAQVSSVANRVIQPQISSNGTAVDLNLHGSGEALTNSTGTQNSTASIGYSSSGQPIFCRPPSIMKNGAFFLGQDTCPFIYTDEEGKPQVSFDPQEASQTPRNSTGAGILPPPPPAATPEPTPSPQPISKKEAPGTECADEATFAMYKSILSVAVGGTLALSSLYNKKWLQGFALSAASWQFVTQAQKASQYDTCYNLTLLLQAIIETATSKPMQFVYAQNLVSNFGSRIPNPFNYLGGCPRIQSIQNNNMPLLKTVFSDLSIIQFVANQAKKNQNTRVNDLQKYLSSEGLPNVFVANDKLVSVFNIRLTNMTTFQNINRLQEISSILGLFIDIESIFSDNEILDKRKVLLDKLKHQCDKETNLSNSFSQNVQKTMKISFDTNVLENFEEIQLSDEYFLHSLNGTKLVVEPVMQMSAISAQSKDFLQNSDLSTQWLDQRSQRRSSYESWRSELNNLKTKTFQEISFGLTEEIEIVKKVLQELIRNEQTSNQLQTEVARYFPTMDNEIINAMKISKDLRASTKTRTLNLLKSYTDIQRLLKAVNVYIFKVEQYLTFLEQLDNEYSSANDIRKKEIFIEFSFVFRLQKESKGFLLQIQEEISFYSFYDEDTATNISEFTISADQKDLYLKNRIKAVQQGSLRAGSIAIERLQSLAPQAAQTNPNVSVLQAKMEEQARLQQMNLVRFAELGKIQSARKAVKKTMENVTNDFEKGPSFFQQIKSFLF